MRVRDIILKVGNGRECERVNNPDDLHLEIALFVKQKMTDAQILKVAREVIHKHGNIPVIFECECEQEVDPEEHEKALVAIERLEGKMKTLVKKLKTAENALEAAKEIPKKKAAPKKKAERKTEPPIEGDGNPGDPGPGNEPDAVA